MQSHPAATPRSELGSNNMTLNTHQTACCADECVLSGRLAGSTQLTGCELNDQLINGFLVCWFYFCAEFALPGIGIFGLPSMDCLVHSPRGLWGSRAQRCAERELVVLSVNKEHGFWSHRCALSSQLETRFLPRATTWKSQRQKKERKTSDISGGCRTALRSWPRRWRCWE